MAGVQVVVGLDIGSTKVCTLIGEVISPHQVQVVGAGISPSRGLKKGLIVDMEGASAAISASLRKAEAFSGYKIIGAFVAVSGGHLESELVHSGISLTGDKPVSRQDLSYLLSTIGAESLPPGRQLLHQIPHSYVVDGEDGIANPIGMLASSIDLDGLVVTSASTALQNLLRCIEPSGIKVDGFVASGIASAQGVLSEHEKRLGVVLLDIGGGTTDVSWYKDGELQCVGAIPVGGNHLTNDLSVGLGVPHSAAEEMKLRYASAIPEKVPEEETVDAGALTDGQVRKVSTRFMAEIVEARVSELFAMTLDQLEEHGYRGVLSGGIVLTGGTAQLRGMRELSQRAFKMQVRVGLPEGLAGPTDSISTPAYATSSGLLKWAMDQPEEASASRPVNHHKEEGLSGRLKGLFKAFVP